MKITKITHFVFGEFSLILKMGQKKVKSTFK
jgi:hypothetical protein